MQKLTTSNPARQSGRHALLAVLSLVVLAACSEPEFKLEGDRIDVLPAQVIETADAAALAEGAGLAVEANIANAPVVGLTAGHAGGNPRLAAPLTQIWSASIGGAGSRLTDLAMPVVGDGRVFTVALNGMVKAFAIDNGAVIWTSNIEQIADDALPGIGGGMAVTADGLAVHALSLIHI